MPDPLIERDPFVILPGESFDASGKYFGPGITRGADQVPTHAPIPDASAFVDLTAGEKLKVSQAYGWYEPPRAYREQVSKYVADFSTLPPGAQSAEVDRLLDTYGSKRAQTQMARSSYRDYQRQAAQNGNPNQRLTWVSESDDSTCEGCEAAEGTEGTADEIDEQTGGGRGNQDCGGNCRCDYIPIEAPQENNWLATGAQAQGLIGEILGA